MADTPPMYDVVVIGSGAGGAPIVNRLVKAGKSVLVLDKGPLFRPQPADGARPNDFRRDEMFGYGPERILQVEGVANNGRPYYPSHVEPDLNDEPHVYRTRNGEDFATMEGYTAQVVGGGTQLYGGVSFRFTETDLRLRSFNDARAIKADPNGQVKSEARDWPITYADLEPYYALAEELVGINGTHDNQLKTFSRETYQKPLKPNTISKYAKAGMEKLAAKLGNGVMPYRTPLAVITEDHAPSGRKIPGRIESIKTSYVNRYGDPLGLKSNTWVSLLAPLEGDPNFTIWPNCVATRLESSSDRITKVHVLDPSGIARTVEGRIVVVACSAIESIRLLMLSSLADADFADRINRNGLLGRYFLTHCFGGASTIVPDRHDKSRALDADWATDCCSTTEFLDANGLWAGGAIYNNTSDQALPVSLFRTYGSRDLDSLWQGFMGNTGLRQDAVVDYLDGEFGRSLSVSFMANQVPQRDNRIELHPRVKDKWGRPCAYVIKSWHEHDVHLMNIYAEQCADVLRLGVPGGRSPSFGGIGNDILARMANHILGGARFGADPADSVLDLHCRAWNFDNLYVTDGSFMPTSGSGNPTLTIQANAFRVADHLKSRM